MNLTLRIWLGLFVPYALFFFWYTSFGGRLQPDEIERYMEVLVARGSKPEQLEVWRHFMETDSGDDFAMFNAIELREKPLAIEGVLPGESSSDVLARYTTPFMKNAMLDAAHPVLIGFAANDAMDLWGIEGAEHWTMGGIVRYRSRRDLMNQAVEMSGLGIHAFKQAAMSKTVAYPLDPWFQLGDPRLLMALILVSVGFALQLRLRPGE